MIIFCYLWLRYKTYINMIKRAILLLASLVTVCCGQHFSNSEIENLKESFANPPQSAKPMVWWHWMNGNVTPEGLRNDILWMHSAGIGGVQYEFPEPHSFKAVANVNQTARSGGHGVPATLRKSLRFI